MAESTVPPLHDDLRTLLVCPLTQTSLRYKAATQELISTAAGLAYPIKNGLPVLLSEEARHLTPVEQTSSH